ncbi:hypothetical protein M5K25_022097 [Dendrobium thyrsiflorum]|uniref:Uncharacterized protein n=1 Tax=Dendrobium thyrsiflorum TaxID=117978 RepID=A0ABD0U5I0_DENTH
MVRGNPEGTQCDTYDEAGIHFSRLDRRRPVTQRGGMGNRCGAYDEKGIFISTRLRGNDCASFRQAFESYNKEDSPIKTQILRRNPILCQQDDRVDKVNGYDRDPLNRVARRQMAPLYYGHGHRPYVPQWHQILEI